MSAFVFDSHEFVKRLKATGFTEEQAEAIVGISRENLEQLATKEDLRHELSSFKSEIIVKLGSMVALATGIVLAAMQLGK